MSVDKASGSPAARYSPSPRSGSNTLHQQVIYEQSELSSDDNDEECRNEDDPDEEDSESLYPELFVDEESRTQRFLSTYRSNSPQLNADASIKKPHCISTDDYYLNIKQAKGQPKFSEGTSTEEWFIQIGKCCCSTFFAVVIFMACMWYTQSSVVQDRPSIESERIKSFKSNIRDIKIRFPGQNHRTWIEIESGVIDVINQSKKPWIFVLFSNETKELSCLAKLLGKASSEALHSEGSLELHPKDMGDDYGLAIDHLKPQIIAKKAVVVHDLLNIDPRAIQAFHTMCDRENPLVKRAVYILTIITPGNVPELEKCVKFVEDQLTNRFINKVPEDKLQPLITRLTDGPIIPVKSEITLTECLL